jgi:peptidoglycan/xylan/chitin deacetylase (PgdA/CDA1 family)
MGVFQRLRAPFGPPSSGARQNAVIALLICVPIVFLIIFTSTVVYFSLNSSPRLLAERLRPAPTPLPITATDADTINDISSIYIQNLLQGNYSELWSMLSPQAQARWLDLATFKDYMKLRFTGYRIGGFSSEKPVRKAYWIDPATMIRHNDVYQVPISLLIDPQIPAAQLSKLAPQFQHPSQLFQNIPLILQRVVVKSSGDRAEEWQLLNMGPADIEAPILPPISPLLKTVKVPILMYHHISDLPTHNELDHSLTVQTTVFKQQLDFLKAQGYHSITFNQLLGALYYKLPLPTKPIIFTFDDGYDDSYTDAYPVLKDHSYSGMFYIISGKVNWKGQATWNQWREMLDNGMQMGSHTIHHVDMGSVYQTSRIQAAQELQISQQDLQKNLRVAIQHFCYPNGGPFKGNNRPLQIAVMDLLASSGYVSATTDPGPTGVVQSSYSPLEMLRLRIDGRSDLQFFKQNILRWSLS